MVMPKRVGSRTLQTVVQGLLAAALLLLLSCAETKYVPEGSWLLVKEEIKEVKKNSEVNEVIEVIDNSSAADSAHQSNVDNFERSDNFDNSDNSERVLSAKALKGEKAKVLRELRTLRRQRLNARWLSAVRLPLAVYSLSGSDTTRWINRALRSMGEPPVLFDSVQAALTVADLTQALHNEGWLHGTARLTTQAKGRRLKAIYMVEPGPVFTIGRVNYVVADTALSRLLAVDDSTSRGLHTGQRFSVKALDAERKRLTSLLTDSGYYRFHKEFITFRADTVKGGHTVDVTLLVGPYRLADGRDTLHTRYRVGSVSYASGSTADTVIHLRRSVLEECTHLTAGDYFSARALTDTYNHFGRLGAVKYTDISLHERAGLPLIDCDIKLQTNKPSTLSFQPEGTNTAGDLGAAASLTYQNRNLFRGSENLSVVLRGAYEAIRGLEGYRNQDFVEYSMEARLTFPRFIVPFLSHEARMAATGVTSEVSLLFDSQDRPEFHRRVLSTAWRYKWGTLSGRSHYQVDVLDLNYVFMPWISETFRRQYLDNENSRNAILRYNYEDLFITKMGFGYAYNNGRVALKTNVESSGNVLHAVSAAVGADKDESGQYRLFNIAFAQYVKGDVDVTRSFRIDYDNEVVLHVGFGLAWPYGNSTVLPFEKRYFSGGANSVRGWSVRSLGPGKFKGHDGNIDFINQTGDMKLDLNAEYRAHLFWKLGGALFVDAGNIWTLRNYHDQPGGQFTLKDFPSQIAVSYGLGLRFNFDYFIVRFDLGMKAVNPAYEEEDDEHYPLLHPRFSRDYAFHFAVGLPF